ncbi:MAG TPA: hypothetical protein VK907_08065, partial [Phnomibacter sp.]|nr:hypothetical protein [Phnomibacter sp.]
MDRPENPEVKVIGKAFADLSEGAKMLIPTPRLIEKYLMNSQKGIAVDVKQMRKDLAADHQADYTCPLT